MCYGFQVCVLSLSDYGGEVVVQEEISNLHV
jgi:hypothetical protein